MSLASNISKINGYMEYPIKYISAIKTVAEIMAFFIVKFKHLSVIYKYLHLSCCPNESTRIKMLLAQKINLFSVSENIWQIWYVRM